MTPLSTHSHKVMNTPLLNEGSVPLKRTETRCVPAKETFLFIYSSGPFFFPRKLNRFTKNCLIPRSPSDMLQKGNFVAKSSIRR